MPELTNPQKLILALLIASLAVTAFRISRMAKAYGRSPVAWFCISLFFTAIPATIVFWIDRQKTISSGHFADSGQDEQDDETLTHCTHCGAVIDQPDEATGQPVCPQCRMKIDQEHLA